MTATRFDFQRQCAQDALDELDGSILNVGANEDPAHLKALSPERVINCDLFEHDQVLDRPNVVDCLFDCAKDRWPFERRDAALVILGDILEHLKPAEIAHALRQARRVGQRLCVTVPNDDRESNCDAVADTMPRGAVHRTIVTEPLLRQALVDAGWQVTEFRQVEYDSGINWGKRIVGYFVSAQ